MIAEVTKWVELIEQELTSEAGQRQLRAVVRSCVRAGTLQILQVVKAAERYRDIDMALRELVAEGLDIDMPELTRTSRLSSSEPWSATSLLTRRAIISEITIAISELEF